MNDRFKFRYIYNGKLYDVLSIDFRRKNIDLKKDEITLIHLESEFNDKNLIQCTAVKDKNGKLIYEGDIVVSTSPRRLSNRPHEVKLYNTTYGHYGYLFIEAEREPLVIGNIYENKELLDERN